MSAQKWRKALWHLRHGGVDGFKQYTRKATSERKTTESSAVHDPSTDGIPTLSVVVPAFNAAGFIGKCLSSILEQSNISLEVIVVDDGSNDATAAIASERSHNDGRVKVLTGSNAGPAQARNRGVEAAQGKYLAFADADDEVLPRAYATMVDSLERTGSDIATGSYIRVGTAGRSRPKLTARVHARQRLAVRLDDVPELLEEPVLWNKVYLRDFWSRHVGEMTSFANYEDQEPAYRALTSAAAIDVLTNDVYVWRLPDGRNTRSRRKAKLADLRARLSVIEALEQTLEHESGMVRDLAHATWMGRDLAMHAEFLDTEAKGFRKTLMAAAANLKKSMSRKSWSLIPAQERLLMWSVASGRLTDVEEILGTRAEETNAVPLEYIEGEWIVTPSYVQRLNTRVPKRLLRAREIDFRPQVTIRSVQWIDQNVIELQGCAFVPGIDPSEVEIHIQGVMDGAVVFDTNVDQVNDNRIDMEVEDPWRSYGSSGFRAWLDLEEFSDLSARGIDLFGHFEVADVQLRAAATSTTIVGMIAPSPVVQGSRVTVVADERGELSIRPVAMPKSPIIAKGVSVQGREITVTLNGAADVRSLELHSWSQTVPMKARGRSIFTGVLPELSERFHGGGERNWSVKAVGVAEERTSVHHEAVDYLLPDTSCVRYVPNVEGAVELEQRFRRVTVTGATSDRDRLLITGRIDPPEKLRIVLKSSDQMIEPSETARHSDGSFTAVYDLTTVGAEGGKVAAMSGGYHVRFGTSHDSKERWARVAGKLAIRPVDCFTEWNTLRLEARSSGAVAITASPPWSSQERTKCGRFALRTRDWGPQTAGIVFESYNGKSANGNPRALFDAIQAGTEGIPLYWSVRDRRVDVPNGGIPVVEGTAAWHQALATSKVWINNNNFPYYVRKRPGQFYLQTWHGTPIKKLLWDIPRRKVPLTYRRLMKHEVPQWDLLLAQSDQAAENLRTGLGYKGTVEVTEYPRNQRLILGLHRPAPLRQRLGLTEDEPVVLYVPTWRSSRRSGKALDWDDLLDVKSLAVDVGARVLVRSHHMENSSPVRGAEVIDVSSHPHVEDLMAIADVLITDFSSIENDFALTGRPVVRFAPDYRAYKKERGLYNNGAGWPVVADLPERDWEHELRSLVSEGLAASAEAVPNIPNIQRNLSRLMSIIEHHHAKLATADNGTIARGQIVLPDEERHHDYTETN